MAKINKDIDLSRLAQAMRRSRLSLRNFREERREAIRQYVGNHWSEEGTDKKVPVNLLALYVNVISRNLIAKNPRVMLSTFQRQHKASVSAMQSWANREIEAMGLYDTLRRVVIDALFSIGIAKVALSTPSDAAMSAWQQDAGKPFIDRVSLDDFVFDPHARDFSEVSFIGHRYRAPLDVVKNSPIYSKQRKELSASTDSLYNPDGDERANVMGRGTYNASDEEFEEHVDLWEIYLPRRRMVITMADEWLSGADGGINNEPLRAQQWLGPDCGPYHILSYGVVPDNAMPKAPVQDLLDLHLFVNQVFRKLMRQAERQKDVTAVRSNTEDGARVANADDGEIIKVDNPGEIKTTAMGGPNQQNFAMFVQGKDLFGYIAGNLDMMGGLSPQSKTLGQDRLLEQNASRSVADMQDSTISLTAKVCKALCWYWWHDPFKTMKVNHSAPGMPDYSIERKLTPEQRKAAKFEDLDISVDPYSLQHSTPQSRLAGLNQVVTQIITPMMPLLQQQGVVFDMNAYLKKVASYQDMPDLGDIVTMQDPPEAQQQPGQDQPGAPKPAETTRNYVRENMPGRTEKGNNMNLINTLMGVDAGGASKNGDGE